jgi:hypothetical protein
VVSLKNALPPSCWLLNEVARLRVPGRRRDSKQDRHPAQPVSAADKVVRDECGPLRLA